MNFTKDTYNSYEEMSIIENSNFKTEFVYNELKYISLIAIHGGMIEKYTDNLVKEIAKIIGCNYFTFESKDKNDNLRLHITSTRFNNPICESIVKESFFTISIHGADEEEDIIYVGGLDYYFINIIKNNLNENNFNVPNKIRSGLKGVSKYNICNKNIRNMGIQLEVSEGYRNKFFDNDKITSLGKLFIETISESIKEMFSIFLNDLSTKNNSIHE